MEGITNLAGLPVSATFDANGQYLTLLFESVSLNSSPFIATFDPPIPVANFQNVGVPQAEQQLATAIAGGGVTFSPYQG